MEPLPFAPTAFVCVADAKTARETRLSDGRVVSVSDPISEAAWLRHESSDGWWKILRNRSARGLATDPGLAPPFDADGRDALGLLEPGSPFRPEGEPLRQWRGTVRAADGHRSAGAGSLVMRDAWATLPDWRVTEMRDFELHGAEGEVVIVRCRKAPLLIARPTTHAARDVEATMYDGTRSELRKHRRANANDEVFVVEIRDGDVVDVLGIDVGTEFVAGSSGGYRESAGRAIPVIGDEDDVRLVLRRVG